jgi:lysophospholipase L1-like esterase
VPPMRAAIVALLLLALLPASAGAACSGSRWLGAWTASPSDGSSTQSVLADRTVRMALTPHVGGDRVRLHLSNRFGSAPVTLAHVTVAIRSAGGALRAGSLRDVPFAGRRAVTIPAGADVVSDPVALSFAPFTKLAVSVAVTGSVRGPTEHFTTRETNYLSAEGSGDHTRDPGAGAFTASTPVQSTGWYFLDGVDVTAAARYGAVATFGDSITDGFQGRATPLTEDTTTIGMDERYPDFLARRLLAAGRALSVLNTGISGNRLLEDGQIPQFGPRGLDRVGADVIRQSGVTDVIVLEGINDIGQTTGITAAQLIDGYRKLVTTLHAAHLRVLLGTLTPARGTVIPSYGVSGESVRAPVNAWIRSQHVADGVVDFDAAVRDPADPARLRPADDGGDHLHLSATGYQAMAGAVPLGLLHGTGCRHRRVTMRVALSRPHKARLRRARSRLGGRVGLDGPGDVTLTAVLQRVRGGRVVGARTLARGRVHFLSGGRKAVRLAVLRSGRRSLGTRRPGRLRVALTGRYRDVDGRRYRVTTRRALAR